MMGPKDRLAEILFRSGALRLLRRVTRPALVVFCYHRIRPDDPAFTPPFDADVFGPSQSQFRAQMQWLREHTRLVGERELVAWERPPRARGPSVAVTFDDGYADNFHLALPVLEQLAIPAFFFVPTELVEQRRVGWWDLITYFVRHATVPVIRVDGREYALGADRDATVATLLQRMKRAPAGETGDLVAALSRACGVPFPDPALQAAQLMTWEQVRAAADRGVTIGSHARTHRVLTTLDADALAEELSTSKAVLEQRLARPVRSIAYPCGGPGGHDERVRRAAEAAGYALGFSLGRTVNRDARLAPFEVRRISVPLRIGRFAAMTTLPEMFAFSTPAPT